MRFQRVVLFGALFLLTGAGTKCLADTVGYRAVLTGAQETPPNGSAATGLGLVTLNGNILTVHEVFSGLTTPASAAHIHCCAPPGSAASVVIPFVFPSATSGTFDGTFDLSTFVFPGTLTEATFISNLNNGLTYLNIHNPTYPGGEIRGQLLVTPEPSSLLLLGTGTLGLLGVVRRRVGV